MKIGTPSRLGARVFMCALINIFCLAHAGLGQPATYFAAAEGQAGSTLDATLRDIIDGHTPVSYTPGVWNAHKDLYEDPNDSSRLILFYSQASWDKSAQDPGSGSEQYWNREHLWPRSYGVDESSVSNTDLFNLVPANKAVNNDRSNQYFDYANPGLSGYADPAHPLAPQCKENTDIWEPGDGQKGWVARALFYMATRYINLVLSDAPPAPSTSASRMAQLSTLLKWNRQFLPSAKEQEVNERIFTTYQFNRNPYIDFPEFADAVYVTGPSWGSWRLAHFTLSELLDPDISGDHADPDKDGLNNLIEMARYSDPRNPADGIPVDGDLSGNTVNITYIRASNQENLNLVMIFEASPDLENWESVDLSEATTDTLNTYQESVTVTRTIPPGSAEFYRLQVSRPE